MKENKKHCRKPRKIGLWHFIARQKWALLLYVMLIGAGAGVSFLAVLWTAKFIDQVTFLNFGASTKYLLLGIGMNIAYFGVGLVAWNIFIWATQNIVREIRGALVDRAFRLKSKTFSDNSAGTFITRITRDPNDAITGLDQLIDSLASIVTFIITVTYICFLNVWLALMFVGAIALSGGFEFVRMKIKVALIASQKKVIDRNTSLVNEVVRSERDIKSLDLEPRMRAVTYDSFDKLKRAHRKLHHINVSLWSLRNMLTLASTIAILYVGIVLLKSGALTIAALMFLLVNRSSLGDLIYHIGAIAQSWGDIHVASKRMFEVLNDDLYPTEKFGDKDLPAPVGDIEFKGVSFTYNNENKTGEVTSPAPPHVLSNMSFTIPHGKTVAFVGRSGSGKSTILGLISKLYDATSGTVLLDNHDIQTLSRATIRTTISLVNQFPYIFDATIRENLTMATEAGGSGGVTPHDDSSLHEILKRASLDEFVATLPEGLDTRVGESGIKLSGGQRQRLAIARALLKKSKVILFDESTSSLDNHTQEDIKHSIAALRGHTVIIVAHRLSTIKDCDTIFFIDAGKIVASGTYEYLRAHNKEFNDFFLAEAV